MPETPDVFASVGYLVAAAGITLVTLVGYGVIMARRLTGERARNQELRTRG